MAPRRYTATIYFWLIAALVLITGGGVVAITRNNTSGDAGPVGPTFTVRQGPLLISVSERGTIQAREQLTLSSEVEGQNQIIYLIEEGTQVEAGDLLVELDVSNLQDRQVDQQIRVQNTDASLIRARENLEVTRSQAESDIARAELDYEFANEDLRQFKEADFPKQKMEAENRIRLTEEQFKQAEQTLAWSDRLLTDRFISDTERDRDFLAYQRAEVDVQVAREELNVLENFTYHRRLREFESEVDQRRMALERVKRRAAADIVQAEAELRARKAEHEQQTARLERIEEQLEKARIYAPREGMVVHATTGQRGREPLEEGQMVRERQDLILLPTAKRMMAEIKIPESSLARVRVGMPVRVRVDALPGQSFRGTVARIAQMPDSQSWWSNPDLTLFTTHVHLDSVDENVRTGMTCQAEIVVDRLEDAVYVPVQAIVRVEGQPTAYVVGPRGRLEPRRVELGLDNNREVHIKSGLSAGEVVSLTPPLTDDTRPFDPEGEAEEEVAADGAGAEASEQTPTTAEDEADDAATTPTPADEQRERARRAMENLTDEQRQQLRDMTPEQRRELRQRMQQSAGDGADESAPTAPSRDRGDGPRGGGPGGGRGGDSR